MQHTESAIQIYFTKEYKRFKMIEGNRQLNSAKIKNIQKDISSGLDVLRFCPILVIENDERLEIIDGQHRFWIAKQMASPVWYVIAKKIELVDIARINSNTDKWKVKDFINCYVQQGNQNYIQLQSFMDRYQFSNGVAIKLLATGNPGTESGLDDNKAKDFQTGHFKVNFITEATLFAERVLKFNSFKFYKDRGFIIALHRIEKAGKVTLEDLHSKYEKWQDMLQKQSGFKEYIFNLESIYNKGKQTRVVIY